MATEDPWVTRQRQLETAHRRMGQLGGGLGALGGILGGGLGGFGVSIPPPSRHFNVTHKCPWCGEEGELSKMVQTKRHKVLFWFHHECWARHQDLQREIPVLRRARRWRRAIRVARRLLWNE